MDVGKEGTTLGTGAYEAVTPSHILVQHRLRDRGEQLRLRVVLHESSGLSILATKPPSIESIIFHHSAKTGAFARGCSLANMTLSFL